jgi:hypothetical protein
MAVHKCQICGERDADVLLSLTATGESEFDCLLCLPFRVADLYESVGLPRLVFDVSEAGPEPSEVVDIRPEAPRAARRPRGGRKRAAAGGQDAPGESEAGDSDATN